MRRPELDRARRGDPFDRTARANPVQWRKSGPAHPCSCVERDEEQNA